MLGDRHSYVPAFDGLRGVAILPVILLHVGVNTLPHSRLLYELTRGWYGVDLFFVLSGFLITWILLTEIDASGTIDIGRFYGRRFLRLAPAYVSMLIAVLIGAALLRPHALAKVPEVLPTLLTYTYNYELAAEQPHFNILVVVWSLCVEQQFYMIWPWVLRRLGARNALRFCLGAIVVLSFYRTGLYALLNWGHLSHPSPVSAIWIYFATDTRIGVILIGCTAALSLRHPYARRLWAWMRESRALVPTAFVVACACIFFVTGGRPSSASLRSGTLGYTIAACATAALIGCLFAQPTSALSRGLGWRPLVSLGRVSYGVYLFHPAIAWLVLRYVLSTRWAGEVLSGAIPRFAVAALVVLVVAWTVAALHYWYVERWFMSLRKPVSGVAALPGRERSSEQVVPTS